MNGRKTVFLVDDDMTNLTLGESALINYYNVFTLNSGTRLLAILEKKIPDLILLDVEMPEMNGYEVIKIIKNMQEVNSVPIIFLTAKNDSESELEGLSLGAVDYIIKPFSKPLLLKRLELHLLVQSQKHELIRFNENLLEMVKEKTKTVTELQNAILRTMAELIEYRDNITGSHIDRTQHYLSILIDAIKDSGLYKSEVSEWDMELILQSAQLHDVGKIAIEDRILKKAGKLTSEEFNKIKTHAAFGEKVIERIKQRTSHHAFLEQARILAYTHHEKWDGSGYPQGLRGEDIPLQGRLMAIADVYDALVSDRPYKKAFTHEQAVNIIKEESGTHFDPSLVDLFCLFADKFKKDS